YGSGSARPTSMPAVATGSRPPSERSSLLSARRTAYSVKSVTFSKGRRLSSQGKPDERVPVHRGGGRRAAQRVEVLRPARGFPFRLLRLGGAQPVPPGPFRPCPGRANR